MVRNGTQVLHVSTPPPLGAPGRGADEIPELQESIAGLENVCQRYPEDFGTHQRLFDCNYRLGELLYARGRNAEAKAAFDKAYQHGLRFIELQAENAGNRRSVATYMSACPLPEAQPRQGDGVGQAGHGDAGGPFQFRLLGNRASIAPDNGETPSQASKNG